MRLHRVVAAVVPRPLRRPAALRPGEAEREGESRVAAPPSAACAGDSPSFPPLKAGVARLLKTAFMGFTPLLLLLMDSWFNWVVPGVHFQQNNSKFVLSTPFSAVVFRLWGGIKPRCLSY